MVARRSARQRAPLDSSGQRARLAVLSASHGEGPAVAVPGGLKGRGGLGEARRRKHSETAKPSRKPCGRLACRPHDTAGRRPRRVVRKAQSAFRHHERALLSRTTARVSRAERTRPRESFALPVRATRERRGLSRAQSLSRRVIRRRSRTPGHRLIRRIERTTRNVLTDGAILPPEWN